MRRRVSPPISAVLRVVSGAGAEGFRVLAVVGCEQMTKPKFTNAAILAATKLGSATEIRDPLVPGLHVRVGANGSAHFALRWCRGGQRRKVSLGRFGVLSVEQARSLARERLAAVAGGDVAQVVVGLTLGQLLAPDGWFATAYSSTAGKRDRGGPKSPKVLADQMWAVRRHLASRVLWTMPIERVTVAHLAAVKADSSPGVWRTLRAILGVVFRHAVEVGARTSSPMGARDLRAQPAGRVDRFLSAAERHRVEIELARAEKIGGGRGRQGALDPRAVRAIRLLLLTGMRRSEVAAMRWQDLDLGRSLVRLPVSKTGRDQTRPLSSAAVQYLRGLVAAHKGSGDELVCDGVSAVAISRVWTKLSERADCSDVRLHDLRHTLASDMLSAGAPLAVVGRVLGHTSPATTARYAHLSDDAVAAGLEAMVEHRRRAEASLTSAAE